MSLASCSVLSIPTKIFHPKNLGVNEPAPQQTRRQELVDLNRNIDEESSNLLDNDISLVTPSNSLVTMAQDPDAIYKALRHLPEFDGNPNVLTRFVKLCDEIVTRFVSSTPGSELNNLCILNGILNKITGPAASRINANGIPDNWTGIRNALVNNFSDQRDETALYNDLSLASQGNSTPQEFYDHCQTLFSTIMTYVTLHETLPTTIEAKRELYKKLTKQAFVRGLKEPLGSRIRCMRPASVDEALQFVQDELNVIYMQQKYTFSSEKKSHQPTQIPRLPPVVASAMPAMPSLPVARSYNFQPSNNWQQTMPPQQQPWKPNLHTNNFQPRMSNMPTRTQQIFRAMPSGYNPQNNSFRFIPRNQTPNQGPRPMSGVSHFTTKPLPPSGHDWRKFGNPPPSNYFKTREMNFNQCLGYDEQYYLNNDDTNEPDCNYEIECMPNDSYYETYDCYATPSTPYHDMHNFSLDDDDRAPEPQPSASTSGQNFPEVRLSKKLK